MIAPATPTDEQIQREFIHLLPEISSRLHYRFYEHGPDLEAEFVAEAVAQGWDLYRSARRRGKTISAGNVTWFVIKAVLSGRKLAGSSSVDVMSGNAQKRIGRVVSFDGDDGIYDIIIDRRWKWPVVRVVGTRLDWNAFVTTCRDRDQMILRMRTQGYRHKEIASMAGISSPAITQRLAKLKRDWTKYSGAQA